MLVWINAQIADFMWSRQFGPEIDSMYGFRRALQQEQHAGRQARLRHVFKFFIYKGIDVFSMSLNSLASRVSEAPDTRTCSGLYLRRIEMRDVFGVLRLPEITVVISSSRFAEIRLLPHSDARHFSVLMSL